MRFLPLLALCLTLAACQVDNDGDGYTTSTHAFDPMFDCNDEDKFVHPNGPEYCNGRDDNCNGDIDENPSNGDTWYLDADGDGHGDGTKFISACERPDDYVDNSNDCNDRDPSTYVGAQEICDGKDNNCRHGVDEDCPAEEEEEVAQP